MKYRISSIGIHCAIAFVFAITFVFAIALLSALDIFWDFFPDSGLEIAGGFFLVVIALLQMLYYILLSYNGFWITLAAFLLNYIFWVVEQVIIHSMFAESNFYIFGNWKYGVCMLSAFLWAANKLIIDWGFAKLKVRFKPRNLAERIMKVR